MKRKIVLPMKYPPITSYPPHADLLSIILNYKESLPWFYSHYIQLAYFKGPFDTSARIEFFKPSLWHDCPFVKNEKAGRKLIKKEWSNFCDFLIDRINSGQYIYFYINKFFVSSYSEQYQKRHMIHDIFIFGYDIDNQTFNIADFFNYSKYDYTSASFSEIEQGYQNLHAAHPPKNKKEIELLNYQLPDNEYIFNKNIPAGFIEDYLSSNNTGQRYKTIHPDKIYYYQAYGMNVYDILLDYLQMIIDNKIEKIDIRSFHTLYDHKNLMLHRIKYFTEHHYIQSGESLYESYLKIAEEVLIIRNMMIKYQFSKKIQLIYDVISKIHHIIPKEYDNLQIILQELQSL